MNLSSIDLNLLIALDALIAEAHVGRAARKIGLSQPATSHALNRLRDLFSDPLLVRVGSKMQLTPRAAGLRESLTDTLQRVQTLLVADSFEPRSSSRHFSVMMQDHIAHLIVPALVDRLQSDAPGVTLTVLPWQSPASLKSDRLQSIDLMISCSGNEIAGFEREKLFTDTEVTVVRKGHPAGPQLENLKTFLKAMHVAVVGKGINEDPVDAWLRQERLARRIVLRVPSYLQALQSVAGSDLVAFVPQRLAASLVKALSLTLIRPPIDPGRYQEYLLYPRRDAQDSASIWLRKLTREIGEHHQHGAMPYRQGESSEAIAQPRMHSLLERKSMIT
jgi:DNA-binding transcriptional LysR family regulator